MTTRKITQNHVSITLRKQGLELRRKILAYMVDNPGTSQQAIADRFAVTEMTVSRHVAHIRKGWRP